jgi:hypothetical protein
MGKAIKRVSARKYRGLGDVVEVVAAPVAGWLDVVLGTDLQRCKGCAGRKEWLNRAVKFGSAK